MQIKILYMLRATSIVMVAGLLLFSCTTPSVVTTYNSRNNYRDNIHAILVAGVIATEDSLTRNQVENHFALELKKLGYHAVPSAVAFGPKGLSNLGQEETLIKLCNFGFDAVLTIALIDGSKEKYKSARRTDAEASAYYLDRIWNYEKIQADLSVEKKGTMRFWECILFDLYSLHPIGAVQTQLHDVNESGSVKSDLAKIVTVKMIKEKILRKRKNSKQSVADRPIVKQ